MDSHRFAITQPGLKNEPVELACRVLVLTTCIDSGTIMGMLKGGADGYLLKDEDPSVIHDALRAVASRQTWISQTISEQLVLLTREEGSIVGNSFVSQFLSLVSTFDGLLQYL